MYNLFLDDQRRLPFVDVRAWEVVRSYNAFVEKITKDGLPTFISFDHDLADTHYPTNFEDMKQPIDYKSERYSKEKTGYHCAVWLVNYCQDKTLPLPEWQVHSMNPVGRVNINQLLRNYKEYEQRQSNSEG